MSCWSRRFSWVLLCLLGCSAADTQQNRNGPVLPGAPAAGVGATGFGTAGTTGEPGFGNSSAPTTPQNHFDAGQAQPASTMPKVRTIDPISIDQCTGMNP